MILTDIFGELTAAVRGVVFYLFVLDVLVLAGLTGALICRLRDTRKQKRAERDEMERYFSAARLGGGGGIGPSRSPYVGTNGRSYTQD